MLYSTPNFGLGIRVFGSDRIMDGEGIARAMTHIALNDAQRDLSELIAAVGRGEELVITVDGVRAAIVTAPIEPSPQEQPRFGSARGQVRMSDDFDTPMRLVDDI